MTALLSLVLVAAPGCSDALAAAVGLESPRDLALGAPALVARLVDRGAGGPADALAAEADAFAEAARSGEVDLAPLAERFRARLARQCDLAAERPAGAALQPGDRRTLDDILSRPEFREARVDRGALGRWLAELWRRVLDLLGTEQAGRYAAGGRTAFFAAVVVVAAAGLAFALRRRRAASRKRPEAPAPPPPVRRDDVMDRAAFGRFSVRGSFLSLLEVLERRAWIPRGRALTNRELASHLAAVPRLPPGLSSGFAELAARFDRAVYGGAPMDHRDVMAFFHQALRLRTLAEADS